MMFKIAPLNTFQKNENFPLSLVYKKIFTHATDDALVIYILEEEVDGEERDENDHDHTLNEMCEKKD